jgi:hypothetical protein
MLGNKDHSEHSSMNPVEGKIVVDLEEDGAANVEHRNDENGNSCRKVKLSLCLTRHHTMEAYWGVEV